MIHNNGDFPCYSNHTQDWEIVIDTFGNLIALGPRCGCVPGVERIIDRQRTKTAIAMRLIVWQTKLRKKGSIVEYNRALLLYF